MATTQSPTSILSESPSVSGRKPDWSMRMTATSVCGSVPTTLAGKTRSSESVTSIWSAPFTTWLSVRMMPSLSTTNPVPSPWVSLCRTRPKKPGSDSSPTVENRDDARVDPLGDLGERHRRGLTARAHGGLKGHRGRRYRSKWRSGRRARERHGPGGELFALARGAPRQALAPGLRQRHGHSENEDDATGATHAHFFDADFFSASTNRMRRSKSTCVRRRSSSPVRFPFVFSSRRPEEIDGLTGQDEVRLELLGLGVRNVAEVHDHGLAQRQDERREVDDGESVIGRRRTGPVLILSPRGHRSPAAPCDGLRCSARSRSCRCASRRPSP